MPCHWLPDGEHVSAETGLPSNSIAAPWPLVLWRPIEVRSDSRAMKNTHCGSSYEASIGLIRFFVTQIGVIATKTPKERLLKVSESPNLWSAKDGGVGRTRTFAE